MALQKPCSIEVAGLRQSRWLRLALAVAAVVVVVLVLSLAVALAVVVVSGQEGAWCEAGLQSRDRDLENPALFNDLTPSEMRAVRDFLMQQEALRLTPIDQATVNSSYIFMIDLQVPLKTAVLAYMDGGRRKPGRAAIAVLYRGDQDPPRVEEHIVGPLPHPSYHRAATNPAYRKTSLPFSSRPMDSVERRELRAFLERETRVLEPLFEESYQLSYQGCHGPECLMLVDLPPRGSESGERRSWFWGFRQVEGAPLHPLGFAIQVDHLTPDPAKWKVTRVVYNGQLFYEVEDLMERYREDSVRKIRLPMDDYDRGFSSFERRGPSRFDSTGRGPRQVEPDGHRFTVDGQFVKYFGWTFNYRMRCSTGLQLFDVNFQDGRIAYEVSLQEAAVFYSGHSPEVSRLSLYGSAWMLGASAQPLVPGLDCPASAHFIDTFHFHDAPSPRRSKRAVCVFELSEGVPLRRHYNAELDLSSREFQFYGGAAASVLVVRAISVVWNKDWVTDYVFHLDGTLQVRVSSTGHPLVTFSLPRERPFGHRVHRDLIANLHQELFHFKLDLDIGGTANRYKTVEVTSEDVANFWSPSHNTSKMRSHSKVVHTERGSAWNLQSSHLKQHVIFNHKLKNRYGEQRGYRLIHQSPTDFVLKDAAVAQAAGWAAYPLVLTKYKDIEEASSSIYAQGDPWDPVLDWRMYLEDNNTIVDEDLVAWATLGGLVLPCAEDVPSPTVTTRTYSLMLAPHNYFNTGPSQVLSDALRVTRYRHPDTGQWGDVVMDSFGTSRDPPRCVQKETPLHDFSKVDDGEE